MSVIGSIQSSRDGAAAASKSKPGSLASNSPAFSMIAANGLEQRVGSGSNDLTLAVLFGEMKSSSPSSLVLFPLLSSDISSESGAPKTPDAGCTSAVPTAPSVECSGKSQCQKTQAPPKPLAQQTPPQPSDPETQ